MNFHAFAQKVAERICPANKNLAVESLLGLYNFADLWSAQSESFLKANLRGEQKRLLLQVHSLLDLEPMQYCVSILTASDNLTLRALAKDNVFRHKKLREIALESRNTTWLSQKQGSDKIIIRLTHFEKTVLKTLTYLRTKTSLPQLAKASVLEHSEIQKLCHKWQAAKLTAKAQTTK